MKLYLTTDEMRRFLYIEPGEEEELLTDLIEEAQDIVGSYLEYADLDDFERSDGTLPAGLKGAIKTYVACRYGSREALTKDQEETVKLGVVHYAKLTPKKGGAR